VFWFVAVGKHFPTFALHRPAIEICWLEIGLQYLATAKQFPINALWFRASALQGTKTLFMLEVEE
jgi:hypothetical protein